MEDNEEKGMSLLDILNILKKNIVWIIVSTIVFASCSFIYASAIRKPRYSSTGRIIVQVYGTYTTGESGYDIQTALRIVETVGLFLKDPIVAEEAAKRVNEKYPELAEYNITTGTISSGLNVSVSETAFYIQLSFSNSHKEIVAPVVNSVIESAKYCAESFPTIKDTIDQVGTASNASRVGTSSATITAIGFFIGVIVGILIAIVRDLVDNTCRNKEEVESILNTKVIGIVPDLNGRGSRNV